MMQTTANIQIILDAVQATYLGNEGVQQCGPANHDGVCYDPNKPHLVYHVYQRKNNCETREDVSCVELGGQFIPVNKPVAEQDSSVLVGAQFKNITGDVLKKEFGECPKGSHYHMSIEDEKKEGFLMFDPVDGNRSFHHFIEDGSCHSNLTDRSTHKRPKGVK